MDKNPACRYVLPGDGEKIKDWMLWPPKAILFDTLLGIFWRCGDFLSAPPDGFEFVKAIGRGGSGEDQRQKFKLITIDAKGNLHDRDPGLWTLNTVLFAERHQLRAGSSCFHHKAVC